MSHSKKEDLVQKVASKIQGQTIRKQGRVDFALESLIDTAKRESGLDTEGLSYLLREEEIQDLDRYQELLRQLQEGNETRDVRDTLEKIEQTYTPQHIETLEKLRDPSSPLGGEIELGVFSTREGDSYHLVVQTPIQKASERGPDPLRRAYIASLQENFRNSGGHIQGLTRSKDPGFIHFYVDIDADYFENNIDVLKETIKSVIEDKETVLDQVNIFTKASNTVLLPAPIMVDEEISDDLANGVVAAYNNHPEYDSHDMAELLRAESHTLYRTARVLEMSTEDLETRTGNGLIDASIITGELSYPRSELLRYLGETQRTEDGWDDLTQDMPDYELLTPIDPSR